MSYLQIKDVTKIYPNGKKAIGNANISIDAGEFVVFVGPSGCGKSTLLRLIAGLESKTQGEVILAGKRINGLEPAERDIAMVFQNYALYPHFSVYKNLAYGLINRKFPKDKIDKRVKETAEMLQLSDYLNNKPNELSGGQRQRVAMGRAIVREPKLFLFDEPLSNLDAKLRATMRLEIKALQRRLGITAVYVTHDQVEAMTMADRIVILSAGKVEQIGTPQEIYHQPANLFVATFMGSPAMNILSATFEHKKLIFDKTNSINIDFNLSEKYQGGQLKVGIRPEEISLANRIKTEDQVLTIKAEVIEDLGAHRLIHAHIGKQPLLIFTDERQLATDKSLEISLAAKSLYLFDPQTGENITANKE